MENKTIHTMIVNVESSTFTVTPPLDIHQGDRNSHILLIKLRNNEDKFISIDEDVTYKIFFYRSSDKKLIESEDVKVENYYRGILSHVLGPTIMTDFGKYTCTLRGYLNDEIISSISFPITVSKAHNYTARTNEIAMTKDFYNELNEHMDDTEIHLQEIDRDFIDTFNDQVGELLKVIKENQMVTELELPEDEDTGLDITKLKSGTYLTMNDGYLKLPLSTIEDDHHIPVNSLLLKNAWLLVRNDSTGYKCNVIAHRRVYSVVRDKDATTPYYTYYMTVDAKNSTDLLFDLITQLREEVELTERKVDEIFDENGNPLENLPEGAYASALAVKDAVNKKVPTIIDDSELNEYMLSSGTYKPLTNNEGNIFKLNDNTILIL